MVRRIPTIPTTSGAHGPETASLHALATRPVVQDHLRSAFDSFLVRSPQALAFARQGLPIAYFRQEELGQPNLNVDEYLTLYCKYNDLFYSYNNESHKHQLLGKQWSYGVPLADRFIAASICIVTVISPLVLGVLIASNTDHWIKGVGSVVGSLIAGLLLLGFCSEVFYPYLIDARIGARETSIKMLIQARVSSLQSFLADLSNREAFFAAHPEEFLRFLEECALPFYRDKKAKIGVTMDRLVARMRETQEGAARHIGKIDNLAFPEGEKEGLKETVRKMEATGLEEFSKAYGYYKKQSDGIDQYTGDIKRMQVAVQVEISRRKIYQDIGEFRQQMAQETLKPVGVAHGEFVEHYFSVHECMQQLTEAVARVQDLMAAELEVEQLLGSVPGPFEPGYQGDSMEGKK